MRRDKKDEFYRVRTKLKNKATRDLGYLNKYHIYINESLTAEKRKHFNEALGVKKELYYKYIWTLNDHIYLRESMETAKVNVSCLDDLNTI